MSTVEAPVKGVSVPPFGIEIDHPRNCDIVLQSIPGCRLRSAISASRHVMDVKTKQPMIPRDQSEGLATFPRTPGMQVHVSPTKCEYTILDPLHGDEEMCGRVQRYMRQHGVYRTMERIDGVPPQKGMLDVHRFKTLVRELSWLVNAGEARVVKGAMPDAEAISKLPGNFLLNPGSEVPNSQPTFEKDYDSWYSQLTKSGG